MRFLWPEERLSAALTGLLRSSGAAPSSGETFPSPSGPAGKWIEAVAARLGCEAEQIETTHGGLERDLPLLPPALLRLPGKGYLAIVSAAAGRLRVLTPDLTVRRLRTSEVLNAIREPFIAPRRAEIEKLLDEAGVSGARRGRAVNAILSEQFTSMKFRDGWVLRIPPGANTRRWLGQVGAIGKACGLAAAHLAQYLLWVASFWIAGQAALNGRLDRGVLLAWALLLATLIPFRLLTTWLQGLIAIGVGGLLKQRLLLGALRLVPEELRSQGMGHFLSQALEAETFETLAINGGIAGLLACLELIVAGVVLGRFAWLLAAWWLLTAALGWRFLKRYRLWTQTRVGMTHELVEAMVGHRTRLAQLPRHLWHEDEDGKLENYLQVSKSLDRSGTLLIAGAPRGWLVLAVAAIAPGFVDGHSLAAAKIAVTLGGILLAFTAFKRLTGSLSDIAAAWVAWTQVAPLFQAARRPELSGALLPDSGGTEAVIEAESVVFRYRDRGEPVLRGCNLSIRPGDRVLLEGRSGGGKSTLAAILSGLREPESGLLLSGGLDLRTLGLDRWRRRIASAPQFHENHVLTETLAFNLLMGRQWPPTPDDMAEAQALCQSLGLGELLERMPGGLLQMVGEGGWQLSHGERSRVFMARALLQGAGTVILDESFAALDPENLRRALECALERAPTLLVIAHP